MVTLPHATPLIPRTENSVHEQSLVPRKKCLKANRNGTPASGRPLFTRRHGNNTERHLACPLPLGRLRCFTSRNRGVSHHTVVSVSTLRQTLEHASVICFTHFFCPPTRTDARHPPRPPRRQQHPPSLYRCSVRRHPCVSPHASHRMQQRCLASQGNGGA